MSEENKALSNRDADAISRGDFDALDEIYAPRWLRRSNRP